MANKIIYRDMSNGDIEVCRELCNELMQHQANVGTMYKNILAGMNFDNRLRPSFEETKIKRLLVAFKGNEAIGYAFSEIINVTEEDKRTMKPFAELMSKEDADGLGLIPPWLPCPTKIGEVVNLYVRPEYRELHIGKNLMDDSMKWFQSFEDVKYILVFVSNGNNPASFYARYGFNFSHDVLNGFIKCYSKNM